LVPALAAAGDYPAYTADYLARAYPERVADPLALGGDYYAVCDSVSCDIIHWDAARMRGEQPTPAEVAAGAPMIFRAPCEAQVLADWRALRGAAWLDEDVSDLALSNLPPAEAEIAATDMAVLRAVRTALIGVPVLGTPGEIDGWGDAALAACTSADAAVRAAQIGWAARVAAVESETGAQVSARVDAALAGVAQ